MKFIKFILVNVILMISLNSSAYDFESDGIYYNLNLNDKTATVTSGDNKYVGYIVIPSSVFYANQELPVAAIGDYAFSGCGSLVSIEIPNSVTSIGNSAFEGSSSLVSIEIPNSVTSIEGSAFRECSSLASIEIPNSVTSIGNLAFNRCSSLVSIEIPNSVTSIGNSAFYECSSLVSIAIPNSVTSIGNYAFYGCSSLVSIAIPNSVTSIGDWAFSRCSSLVSIAISNSVTSIGNYAFYGCSSLVSIEIPNSVTSIGYQAFYGCSSLVSIAIPNSVSSIGGSAFWGCSSLVSIEIPNSVTSIREYAFWGCSSLVSIEIPISVTSIGTAAFEGCSSLVSIDIPISVTSIEGSAFSGCSSLVSIEIPNSVTSIGDLAFEGCRSLKNLLFEDGENKLSLLIRNWIEDHRYWVSFKDSPIEELYIGRNLDFTNASSPFYENTGFKTLSLGKYVTDASSIYPQKQESLEVINCYNPEPPRMWRAFTNAQYAKTIVNIPKGSLKAYQEDDLWGNFWNLEETLPSPDILPSQIVLNVESVELNIGETFQLETTILPEDTTDKTIIWNSSNNEVASVSENGLVSAMSVGEAIITATCGEVSAECIITVLEDAGVESLLANPNSVVSIYTTDGMLLKKDVYIEEIQTLSKGFYILKSGNKSYKIAL